MSDSATRRELEQRVREVVPANPLSLRGDDPADTAIAGVGGLLIGYVWGFWRGRRSRPKQGRH